MRYWLLLPLLLAISCGNPKTENVGIIKGADGTSCSVAYELSEEDVSIGSKISCEDGSYTIVYNGIDGINGKPGENGISCKSTPTVGGAFIQCGDEEPVFLANGANGTNGKNGKNALRKGLSCNVHDLKNWDKSTSLPQALANNPVVGTFTLANLSVPDSQAVNGFPGMPKKIQELVGIEGYALDCSGFINIKTSGQHTLKLLSDDGSRLSIEDDYFVIENQGLHAPVTVSKTANLNRGQNKINVVYYQGPVTQIALQLKLIGPNTSEAVVPSSAFTH